MRAARSVSSRPSRVLPIPASPASRTILPSPRAAASRASSSSISSASRPTRIGHRARTEATMPGMLALGARPDRRAFEVAELAPERSLERGPAFDPIGAAVVVQVVGDLPTEPVLEIPAHQLFDAETRVSRDCVLQAPRPERQMLVARPGHQPRIVAGHPQLIDDVAARVECGEALYPRRPRLVIEEPGQPELVEVVGPQPVLLLIHVAFKPPSRLPHPRVLECVLDAFGLEAGRQAVADRVQHRQRVVPLQGRAPGWQPLAET